MKFLVSKSELILIAGIMWLSVGTLLLKISHSFWAHLSNSSIIINTGFGLGMALILNHFVFQKLVNNNLRRIRSMGEKNFILTFLSWKTYLIIPIMIIIAVSLRHSNIPYHYLYILYLGIGFAKLLVGLGHIQALVKEFRNKTIQNKKT
ncbi:MAG: hypothetical protein K9H49_12355 [Bacteroidales bacterium]|nr:hypothetical protein [Bacteroidales bacterium]MCF8390679.1 hypothetical protein [Bacteroidales bacterium]